MLGTLMINLRQRRPDRSSWATGELSIPSSIEAIEGSLTDVRLLWSILAGRLLHVFTAVRGTGPTDSGTAQLRRLLRVLQTRSGRDGDAKY
jgi:hypothetical protein